MKTLICILFHQNFHMARLLSSAFDFVDSEFYTYIHWECLKCQRRWKRKNRGVRLR